VVEEVVAAWLLEVLGLPRTASVGLVTGCQMANFTGLAAARHAVLKRFGWDVEQDGLIGAPDLRVILGAQAHFTILSGLRMLGIGVSRVVEVPADAEGRMRPDALAALLRGAARPTIVCAQAGNVNTGACDPIGELADLAHGSGAWVHVDGAFGLWAAASPELRRHVEGLAKADSWATDAHKWLNVPFDSGIAIVADPESHRAALTARAVYLVQASGAERDGLDWTPEASRRARAFTLYAVLRTLGRRGLARLVERSCGLARLMADRLAAEPGVRILNDVVLNQVLVGFGAAAGRDPDLLTRATVARIQREGRCWLGGTRWGGREAVRISVSNWSTTEDDIRQAAAAIVEAFRAERMA
jgi:glutamate/tyrosine decarboxylase-like PLP-dependent enzyme